MVITKSPFRMSFFGGGTDSVSYAITEKVKKVDDISHPMVREAMKFLNMHELSIGYNTDLPARTGLGSSSAFANGLLLAFHDLNGEYIDKKELAKEAIHVERDLCGEAGGWQDQIASAFGGLNRIDFRDNDFHVHPVIISPVRKKLLENNLLMFFTGFSRLSFEIQEDTEKNMKANTSHLKEILDLVDEAEEILTDNSSHLDDFGRLLNETWQLKRQLGKKIDDIYSNAISAGALGGKLLGAGGGGFLLFYVPEERQEAVMKKLENLLFIPFAFESDGVETLYYQPEEYQLPVIPVD